MTTSACCEPRDETGEVAHVVLAVAVDLDHDVVAVAQRVRVARAHGPADPEGERQGEHDGPGRGGDGGGRVARVVVDDHDVGTGDVGVHGGHDLTDAGRLVECGDHDEQSTRGAGADVADRRRVGCSSHGYPFP